MFKKEKEPFIKFVCTVPGFEQIEEIQPKPAKKFLPDWWKDIPLMDGRGYTVKACPSFPDYFSQGYVLPLWGDVKLKNLKKEQIYTVDSDNFVSNWSDHSDRQLLNHADVFINNKEINHIFKADSPWRIITPPGYSVLQLPMFYHFNKNFTSIPGIIDTDTYHEANVQILTYSEEVYIERGTPLCVYIPFKRTKYNFSFDTATKDELKHFDILKYDLKTKFIGSGWYRSVQRKRDSNN